MLITIKLSINSAFLGSGKPSMLFFLLINEQNKLHAQLNSAWQKFYNLGPSSIFLETLVFVGLCDLILQQNFFSF